MIDKVERNRKRRINIVVPIETYGTVQEHTDALDIIELEFCEVLRREANRKRTGTGLAGFGVQRLSTNYRGKLGF